jgi:endonuclease-3
MAGAAKLSAIIKTLEQHYGKPFPPISGDPFELVLYENVIYMGTDEKRAAAFAALKKRVGTKPKQLLDASNDQLLEITNMGSIVPVISAKKLRLIAELGHYVFKDDVASVLKLPLKEAKKALMKFPSIGEPAAEKILLFCGAEPILAMDSNVMRVLLRIGYGQEKKNYGATYKSVQAAIAPELSNSCAKLTSIFQLLRRHGKDLCKTNNPHCEECPVLNRCAFGMSRQAHSAHA